MGYHVNKRIKSWLYLVRLYESRAFITMNVGTSISCIHIHILDFTVQSHWVIESEHEIGINFIWLNSVLEEALTHNLIFW